MLGGLEPGLAFGNVGEDFPLVGRINVHEFRVGRRRLHLKPGIGEGGKHTQYTETTKKRNTRLRFNKKRAPEGGGGNKIEREGGCLMSVIQKCHPLGVALRV